MATRSRGRKKITEVRWIRNTASIGALGAGSVALTMVGANPTVKETIMRMRGNFMAYLDGTAAPGVLVIISAGIQLVPAGTGATVLREPFGDAFSSRWLWATSFRLGYEEYVTDVIDSPGITSFRETVDNKAMRIIGPDEEIQFVMTNTTSLAAGSVNAGLDGRMLLGN